MAKITQCEQCVRYNQESGVCRKMWNLPEFDDTECDSFGKDEPSSAELSGTVMDSEPSEVIAPNSSQLSEQYTDMRQRHGCATSWIFFMLVVNISLIVFWLYLIIFVDSTEDIVVEHIGDIIGSIIMVVAVIMLLKWKIWGLYIIVGMAFLNLGVSILVDGKLDNSMFAVAIMFVALSRKANDGMSFLDHLGFTHRRIRIRDNS